MDVDAVSEWDEEEMDDWRREARRQLENEADRLLRETNDGVRTYTERQLARKIRLETPKLPEIEETALPNEAVEYLLRRQVELLVDSARLSRLQAAVLSLALQGWSTRQISARFGIPYTTTKRLLASGRRRIARSPSPYDGLYEVYWSEVHRYVYRRRRTNAGDLHSSQWVSK